ncbi:MAG: 50S ribosomal protein L24 [Candidatus Woesearchaeota archaeon]
MSKKFSRVWKSSKRKRKQVKYKLNAPFHLRIAFLSAHLEKSLRQKHKRRALPLRVGDKVTVLRGDYKKKSGKITRVDRKNYKIFVEGIELTKKDGSKVFPPLDPSNVMITELNLEDKKRLKTKEAVVKK